MIDPRWQKYTVASVNKFFGDGWITLTATNPSLSATKIYYEGQDIDLNGPEWFEIRMDGVNFNETTKGMFCADFTVNVMVSVKKSDNTYRVQELAGFIQSLFVDIPIMTYPASVPILLGCFRPIRPIRVTNWGEMTVGGDSLRVLNISIEAPYEGQLTSGN